MTNQKNKNPWYIGGLHFQCSQCGRCCRGPDEGYIWVTKPEVERIARHLDITIEKLNSKYLRRVGLRRTIIEDLATKDCIFLENGKCIIYPVRPNQCRTWPFWASNLTNPDAWNLAALRCDGINRGNSYSFEEIEKRRKQKQWWSDEEGK